MGRRSRKGGAFAEQSKVSSLFRTEPVAPPEAAPVASPEAALDKEIVYDIVEKLISPGATDESEVFVVSLSSKEEKEQLPLIIAKLQTAKDDKSNNGVKSAGTGLSTKSAITYLSGFNMGDTTPVIKMSKDNLGKLANKIASGVLGLPQDKWPYGGWRNFFATRPRQIFGGARKTSKIGNKFNRCVKSVRSTVKARKGSNKESAAIAICTNSVLQTRGRTMKRYRKKRLITQKKFRGGAEGTCS